MSVACPGCQHGLAVHHVRRDMSIYCATQIESISLGQTYQWSCRCAGGIFRPVPEHPGWEIVSTCQRPTGPPHETVTVIRGITEEAAEIYAALGDGSSPMFDFSPLEYPLPWSLVGRCVVCGERITNIARPASA